MKLGLRNEEKKKMSASPTKNTADNKGIKIRWYFNIGQTIKKNKMYASSICFFFSLFTKLKETSLLWTEAFGIKSFPQAKNK